MPKPNAEGYYHRDRNRTTRRPSLSHHQPRNPTTHQTNHRANREIYPSRDNHKGHSNSQQTIKPGPLKQLPLIVSPQEILSQDRRRHINHNQGDQDAFDFFHFILLY